MKENRPLDPYIMILLAVIFICWIINFSNAPSRHHPSEDKSHTRGLVHIDPEKNAVHAKAFFYSPKLAIKNDTVYAREFILTRGRLEIRNDTIFAYDFILSDGRSALVDKEQWMGQ